MLLRLAEFELQCVKRRICSRFSLMNENWSTQHAQKVHSHARKNQMNRILQVVLQVLVQEATIHAGQRGP